MTFAADANAGPVLNEFGGDPQRAEGLAAFLGFEPISNPEDQLAGPLSGGLRQFFARRDDRFGVSELYRVGSRAASPATAGLYIGVLTEWGHRSSDRDRPRRRIARALVEYVQDRRSLALLVPPDGRRPEAELVFPRTRVDGPGGAVTTIRAHLDLDNPTRFHRDLLRGLRITPGASLLDISTRWQREFSVERATTKFYRDYAAVRDRVAQALLDRNQDHLVVGSFGDKDEARARAQAWATRQMGRILFLWFLQAKQWLGRAGGHGSPTYLRDLWDRRTETPKGEYYRGVLAPLFFDALATGSSSQGENEVLGSVPYLNGGLFRRSALEDRINDAGEVSVPDEVFDPSDDDSLLGLLSRYRFTTRESTPDDQSVDPDPELLGRVFENLYQADERRKTGTYYTPREIVHFMCRQALDGYLRDKTGVEQPMLDALREEATGSRDEPSAVTGVPADALIDALETVRVCDPAVGSGAFLLGTIQEIVTLRRGILFTQRGHIEHHDLYQMVSDWKRRTIENSLYGVDINPEAVEICRLRLWLSLVLDMDEPPAPNSGWALPNLDFQIVAGDSLVDRLPGVVFKESWPLPKSLQLGLDVQRELQRLEDNIAQRKREFGNTHRNPMRLRELRDLIARDQRQIVRVHLADALAKAEAEIETLDKSDRLAKAALRKATGLRDHVLPLLQQIEATDFALVQKPLLWPVAFPEVLRVGDADTAGFDIVLANPPYVRQEKLDAKEQKSYAESFPEVHAGTADLLVYFYARALQILRPGGWLAFITSNKFMRAGYGAKIREHLPASLRIQRVIDFGDLPLFEAEGKTIAAYPAVVVGSRRQDTAEHALTVADLAGLVRGELSSANLKVNGEGVRSALEDLSGLLARAETRGFPQVMLKKDGWVLEDPVLIRLFERLMNQGLPLRDFVGGRLYRGLVTGLNEAFVIDQNKRDELIEEDPRSAELIKPWLRGRDIKRWKAGWAGLYVIAIQNSGDAGASNPWASGNSEEKARAIFREAYPAIHNHLSYFERFKDRAGKERGLRIRQDHGRFWWELRPCAYYGEFGRPKIIFNRFINSPSFSYDTSGAYHNDACYLVVPPDPSLAATINSTVVWWLLSHLCTGLQNGYMQVFTQFLERLPIPLLSEDIARRLTQHVQTLLTVIDAPNIEREIDGLVFESYGVSAREQKLVLDWLSERQEVRGLEIDPEWRKANALRAAAGSWKDSIDGEQLKRDIAESRQLGTRPVPRL